MTTRYNVNPVLQSVNGWGLQVPDDSYSATLAAATNQAVTVPLTGVVGNAGRTTSIDGAIPNTAKNRFVAIFKYTHATTADFWVSIGSTAAVPAGGTFLATTSILNPDALSVKGGDIINVISATGGVVNILFYGMQN